MGVGEEGREGRWRMGRLIDLTHLRWLQGTPGPRCDGAGVVRRCGGWLGGGWGMDEWGGRLTVMMTGIWMDVEVLWSAWI